MPVAIKNENTFVEFLGDVNITYGTMLIKDCGNHAEVIQVHDNSDFLPGTVSVEHGTVDLPKRDDLMSALDVCDYSVHRSMDAETRRYNIWYSLVQNWGLDDESPILIQHEYGPAQKGVKFFVDGGEGLRTWIEEYVQNGDSFVRWS